MHLKRTPNYKNEKLNYVFNRKGSTHYVISLPVYF